jgi:hypothetical protein
MCKILDFDKYKENKILKEMNIAYSGYPKIGDYEINPKIFEKDIFELIKNDSDED